MSLYPSPSPTVASLAPTIAPERLDDVELVRLAGELDLHAASELGDAFMAAAAASKRVVVDLTEVDFFDSSALGALLLLQGRLARTGGRLAVVVAGLEAPRVFHVTGLDAVFRMTSSLGEALEAVRR